MYMLRILLALWISLGVLACNNKQAPRQDVPDLPNIPDCVNASSMEDAPWMKEAFGKHKPFEVLKYSYLDGWGYQYLTGPVSYFYDCQGTLICETPGKMLNDCARMVQALGKGEKIYIKD